MQVPIACTLSASEVADRTEEWRHFFRTSIQSAEMGRTGNLRLQLKQSPEVLSAAADLAQREVQCCAFFDFSIVIRSDGCWLTMAVPPDARGILDDFVGLLPADVARVLAEPTDVRPAEPETHSDL